MDSNSLSDGQLVSSLRAGDQSAMTEIYHRYWRKLLAIAFNHTRDKSSAEEIVQDVMIKLWDRRADLKIESLNNYLAVSVKYSVYNHVVREKRRAQLAKDNFSTIDFNPDDERIYSQFLEEHINRAVDTLPEKCRLVFKFSRYEGKTIRQISHEMDISEKTVEAHLTKALRSLRLSLRNTGWLSLLLFFLR